MAAVALTIRTCHECETSVYPHPQLGWVEYFTGHLHDGCQVLPELDLEPWEDIDL